MQVCSGVPPALGGHGAAAGAVLPRLRRRRVERRRRPRDPATAAGRARHGARSTRAHALPRCRRARCKPAARCGARRAARRSRHGAFLRALPHPTDSTVAAMHDTHCASHPALAVPPLQLPARWLLLHGLPPCIAAYAAVCAALCTEAASGRGTSGAALPPCSAAAVYKCPCVWCLISYVPGRNEASSTASCPSTRRRQPRSPPPHPPVPRVLLLLKDALRTPQRPPYGVHPSHHVDNQVHHRAAGHRYRAAPCHYGNITAVKEGYESNCRQRTYRWSPLAVSCAAVPRATTACSARPGRLASASPLVHQSPQACRAAVPAPIGTPLLYASDRRHHESDSPTMAFRIQCCAATRRV